MTNEMKQLLNAVTMQVNATIDAYNESIKNKDLSCGGKRGKEAKEARREAGLAAVEACDEVYELMEALRCLGNKTIAARNDAWFNALTVKDRREHGAM